MLVHTTENRSISNRSEKWDWYFPNDCKLIDVVCENQHCFQINLLLTVRLSIDCLCKWHLSYYIAFVAASSALLTEGEHYSVKCSLKHWCLGKMDAVLLTTFQITEIIEISVQFVPTNQISHYRFRWGFGAEQATCHYLNPWWPSLLMHTWVIRLRWVNFLMSDNWRPLDVLWLSYLYWVNPFPQRCIPLIVDVLGAHIFYIFIMLCGVACANCLKCLIISLLHHIYYWVQLKWYFQINHTDIIRCLSLDVQIMN